MTDRSDFLAVDWGTTNRRFFIFSGGRLAYSERDGLGIRSIRPGGYPNAIAELRSRFPGLPMILAGMVGSNRGWIDAGYVDAPTDLAALARRALRPEKDILLVPGVRWMGGPRADVMRGEEVQILGAAVSGLAPPDGLLCQPGTHCKWAHLSDGRLDRFTTAMTGEMFALLREHALIGDALQGGVRPDVDFRRGVADSEAGDLLGALFSIRPGAMLGTAPGRSWASYASGLLIGADCRAHAKAETIYLLADDKLGSLYAEALASMGIASRLTDSHAAFAAGIAYIWEQVE